MNSQNIFNAMVEEKLLKIDDLARNVDRISHEIDSFKIRSMPPKLDINEPLKSIKILLMKVGREPLGCVLREIGSKSMFF